MSSITLEPNFSRKAHRVNFPLFIEIAGKSYPAKDWSMTGVGLLNMDREFTSREHIPARVILPLVDSVLTLNVTLVFVRRHANGVAGFEFADLTPRTKRILRHYIELAVEGRVDNLEDLVAVATTPGVYSPLEDALNLTELESESMLKNFQKKSKFVLALGSLFILIVVGVLLYNTAYRVQAIGFVAGNLERVTANHDGILTSVEVTEKAFVPQGTSLFRIEAVSSPQQSHRVNTVYASNTAVAAEGVIPVTTQLLESLRQEVNARRSEYNNAVKLYNERVISQNDLMTVRNQYLQAQSNWLREQERYQERLSEQALQQAQQLQQQAMLTKNSIDEPEQWVIKAPSAGIIYKIAKHRGEFVRANDPVILIQRNVKPHVLIRLLSEDALKLNLGMPAEVYVPFEDRTLKAEVSAIGHAAVSAEMTESIEGSLNETLVKLEFSDPNVRLPANARVKVWIRTL